MRSRRYIMKNRAIKPASQVPDFKQVLKTASAAPEPTRLRMVLHNDLLITKLNPRVQARIAHEKATRLKGMKNHAEFDDLDQEGNAVSTGMKNITDRGDSAGASWDGFDPETMRVKPSPESQQLLANLSNKELIEYTGCHFTTVYRWRRQKKLPPHIEKLLKFVALKELDQFAGWEGWRIENEL